MNVCVQWVGHVSTHILISLTKKTTMTIKNKITGEVLLVIDSLVSVSLGGACEVCTFEGADLKGADFAGADLGGTNFRGADLRNANFKGANLKGVDFEGADLEGANLQGAYLKGANLKGANFEGADLEGANLQGANLKGADFEGADLGGANFEGADLGGANFEGTNFEGAYLKGAYLKGAYLKGAYFTGVDLKVANLEVPTIENIHTKIYEAAKEEGALNMEEFHSCGTTHCRAGWAVHLAGRKGYALEQLIGSASAAYLIYRASDPEAGYALDFYCGEKKALEDMRVLAEPA
jgi:hypothetical protein